MLLKSSYPAHPSRTTAASAGTMALLCRARIGQSRVEAHRLYIDSEEQFCGLVRGPVGMRGEQAIYEADLEHDEQAKCDADDTGSEPQAAIQVAEPFSG